MGESLVTHRLAIVQHEDYAEALRLIRDGEPEPYFGMYYSVATLEKLTAGTEYLLVSMGVPPYRQPHGEAGQLVGIASPSCEEGSDGRPGLAGVAGGSGGSAGAPPPPDQWRVRAADPPRRRLQARRYAGHDGHYLTAQTWREHVVNRWLVRLLNDPAVHLVGNHRVPAAESLVAWGVRRAKVVAWDWPDQPCPSDFPVKTAPPGGAATSPTPVRFAPARGSAT